MTYVNSQSRAHTAHTARKTPDNSRPQITPSFWQNEPPAVGPAPRHTAAVPGGYRPPLDVDVHVAVHLPWPADALRVAARLAPHREEPKAPLALHVRFSGGSPDFANGGFASPVPQDAQPGPAAEQRAPFESRRFVVRPREPQGSVAEQLAPIVPPRSDLPQHGQARPAAERAVPAVRRRFALETDQRLERLRWSFASCQRDFLAGFAGGSANDKFQLTKHLHWLIYRIASMPAGDARAARFAEVDRMLEMTPQCHPNASRRLANELRTELLRLAMSPWPEPDPPSTFMNTLKPEYLVGTKADRAFFASQLRGIALYVCSVEDENQKAAMFEDLHGLLLREATKDGSSKGKALAKELYLRVLHRAVLACATLEERGGPCRTLCHRMDDQAALLESRR